MKSLRTRAAGLPVYLVVVFLLTYGYELLVLPGLMAQAEGAAMAVSAAMLLPSLSMLLTRLITGEGFRPLLLAPHLKGNARYYLLAWFGPILFTLVGMAVYFAALPGRFDASFSYLASLGVDFSTTPAWLVISLQTVQAALISPAVNLLFCLGEEWGWRGYMMPRLLERFRFAPACLIGGVIWGLWHAPLTIMGHNYGTGYPGYPFTGIFTMCCFCIALGTLLTWLMVKTGSCLPAALAHGGINGCAALGVLLAKPGSTNPFIGPAPTGLLGGAALILAAILVLWRTPADTKISPAE